MGDHEATVEQLEAMHEPLRREQEKKDREADYLARVRARATEKARTILGEAYAERQNVLQEAKAEAEKIGRLSQKEVEALKTAAQEAYREAAEERERARALREEAEKIRDAARNEGLKEGMIQSREELRALRAEMGASLGGILKAIGAQRCALFALWRRELVELVQTAVSAGIGWLLYREEKKILANLAMQALNLLENRNGVIIRVNPVDEQAVSDMFLSAQERYPDMRHWTVKTDPEIQPGGLLAESSSGSVDSTRERFQDLLVNILSHLALPENEQDDIHKNELAAMIEREVSMHAYSLPVLPTAEPAKMTLESPVATDGGHAGGTQDAERQDYAPGDAAEASFTSTGPDFIPQDSDGENGLTEQGGEERSLEPLDQNPQETMDELAETTPEDEAANGLGAENKEMTPAQEENAQTGHAVSANPSYEELEAELFANADDVPAHREILAEGGFLDGNE